MKAKLPIIALLLLCLTTTIPSWGQTITVIDQGSQMPIENVVIIGLDFETVTDGKGQADLSLLPDTSMLSFIHQGYNIHFLRKHRITAHSNIVFLNRKTIQLEEFTISADRISEYTVHVPNKIDVINAKEALQHNPETSADLLANTGKVFVQKSQAGGGSPIVRGFEANKVLLTLDGVRLNNAIYRSGHLQNAITIDPNILLRAEVIHGPGSLIYGSDALGGVIAYYTKNPILSSDEDMRSFGNGLLRFGTNNSSKTAHVDYNIAGSKWGWLGSITYNDFGDSRTGSVAPSNHGTWGQTPTYVERINGQDVVLENDDVYRQRFTGYQQYDLLQKILFQPSPSLQVIGNLQYSNSSNIPRYDKLQEQNEVEETVTLSDGSIDTITVEEPKYALWDYGPQNRLLGSLQLKLSNKTALYDKFTILGAYQDIREQRINRRYQNDAQTTRTEDVDVYSLNLDLFKAINAKSKLYYGFEVTHNKVLSAAESVNITTGETATASTRYPDGGSTLNSYSLYLKHTINLSTRLTSSQGLRFNYIDLHSKFDDTDFFEFDFSEININNGALSGSVDLSYALNEKSRLNFVIGTGYRAPNVDDVGKVFDPSPGFVVVPNSNLKPEYVFNFELGFKKQLEDRLLFDAAIFYTRAQDLIARGASTLNGNSEVVYDGTLSTVLSNVNIGQAHLYGGSAGIRTMLTSQLTLRSTLSYTYGQNLTDDKPLAHIPPINGLTGLKYNWKRFSLDLYARYNAEKKADRYAPNSSDNLEEALETGTPAWFTLNLNSELSLSDQVQLQLGITNILDHHYRPFSSGVSAMGRNVMVALKAGF